MPSELPSAAAVLACPSLPPLQTQKQLKKAGLTNKKQLEKAASKFAVGGH